MHALALQARGQLKASKHAHCRSALASPSGARQRSALVLNAGGLPANLKRGMSMICQMLHGNGTDADSYRPEPTASMGLCDSLCDCHVFVPNSHPCIPANTCQSFASHAVEQPATCAAHTLYGVRSMAHGPRHVPALLTWQVVLWSQHMQGCQQHVTPLLRKQNTTAMAMLSSKLLAVVVEGATQSPEWSARACR